MTTSQKIEPWFSVDEIAKHLRVSKETIYRWLEKGKIPAYRVGKQWRFKATEVDAWVVQGGAHPYEKFSGKVKSI